MSSGAIISQGYFASASLIITLGYGTGAQTPSPPVVEEVQRYGPALTPAERKRWFGDFESPLTRAARRKAREYLQRVEFGILPPEVKEELVEKSTLLIPEKAVEYVQSKRSLQTPAKISSDRVVNAVLKQLRVDIATEIEKRRIIRDEEQEEEDVIVIASSFFLD